MTNEEYRKKYPIGTRIRFLWPNKDTNKVGNLVAYRDGDPVIYLPDGECQHRTMDGVPFTWMCSWKQIELAYTKNEQLLFEFMYEEK